MSPHHPNPVPEQPTPARARPRERLWNRRAMASLYEPLVIRGTYRVLWDCPWPLVDHLYTEIVQAGSTHLEIGPGTGYFLNRLPLSGADLNLHLLDLHAGPLQASAARLDRFSPTQHQDDVLAPFPLPPGSVDSVAMSMVLHCLPGHTITAKVPAFDHVAQVLREGGRFGGATVLAEGVALTSRARAGLRALNRAGVFANRGDSLDDLRAALETRFDDVRCVVHGAVALWLARGRGQ